MEFDVVSVKPNHSGAEQMRIGSAPISDELTVTNMPPEKIFQWAFGIFLNDEIVGLPDRAGKERYDIVAKVSEADAPAFRKVTDPIQCAPMLRKIRVDRFGLKFLFRDERASCLCAGKSGIRMTEIQPAIGPNGMKDGGAREVERPSEILSSPKPLNPNKGKEIELA
jgi:uncharacterized protein (TIGR03435 family)